MINCHQTANCPYCGKDTGQSIWEAMWAPVQCMWCNKWLIYDPNKGSVKSVEKKKEKV